MKFARSFIGLFTVLSLIALCFTSCKKNAESNQDSSSNITPSPDFTVSTDDLFSDRDFQSEEHHAATVSIELLGDTARADSDSVIILGSTVKLTAEATYVITGTLTDGQILVEMPDTAKPQLIFQGATLHSSTSAPLYILKADKVFLTLSEGSENSLSSGESFVAIDENNIDAPLFSKQDLTINGTGALTVTSPVGHGIVCKDDLVISGGVCTVTAASHGIQSNDSVRLSGASLTIDAGKDAIHAENDEDETLGFIYASDSSLMLHAEGDGISAGAYCQIDGGSLSIVSGGGSVNGEQSSSDSYGGFMGGMPWAPSSPSVSEDSDSTSMKGIKAAGNILIESGEFSIDAADDAVHANASVYINGGSFTIATGDDGFHADETLTLTGGSIDISKSYEGLEALHIVVSGGEIRLVASDDGLNAAGGVDASGMGGFHGGDQFGGGRGPGGMGGRVGGGMSASSDGSIVISGGTLAIQSSGDGIDANGTLTITGGHVTVCGPTEGDTATLDYDVSATITGGTFIGTGASGMAQTFSNAEQGVIAVRLGVQEANTLIQIQDRSGTTIVSHTPALSYAVVIVSTPELISGEAYTVIIGENSAEIEAG